MNNKLWHKYLLLLLLLLPTYCFKISGATSEELMQKSVAKISGNVSCNYRVTMKGRAFAGELKSSGIKFYNSNSYGSCWYDGKNMWTYNPSSKETTLTCPTPSEIAESNPLAYVKGYSKYYTSSIVSQGKNGMSTIKLVSKSKFAPAKQVILTINSTTFIPQRLVVTLANGETAQVAISNVRTGNKYSAGEFVYPNKRYPNVEVVDLR